MKQWRFFIAVGLVAVLIRLALNFNSGLIPGINGGYYPYQVKTILNTYRLGFQDMPLYFYLNASIVWMAQLFGYATTNNSIISIMKVVDSISLPILLIPLYYTFRRKMSCRSQHLLIGLIAYSTLSLSPIILIGDLQKNAFGIPFVFLAFLMFWHYLESKQMKYLGFSLASILLISVIHMGILVFLLLTLIIGFLFLNPKRGMLYSIILLVCGVAMMYLIDPNRGSRFLTFWQVLFDKPALLQGPIPLQDLMNIVFSAALSTFALIKAQTHKDIFSPNEILVIRTMAVLMLILAFPLIDIEYFRRFILLLFIPQTILMWFISELFTIRTARRVGLILIIFSVASVGTFCFSPKPAVISPEAYQDLSRLQSTLKLDNNSIIVSRHGLEWWVGFVTGTKIAQDKALDMEFLRKYQDIIILWQKAGINPMPGTDFHEPVAPVQARIVYSSRFYEASRLILK